MDNRRLLGDSFPVKNAIQSWKHPQTAVMTVWCSLDAAPTPQTRYAPLLPKLPLMITGAPSITHVPSKTPSNFGNTLLEREPPPSLLSALTGSGVARVRLTLAEGNDR